MERKATPRRGPRHLLLAIAILCSSLHLSADEIVLQNSGTAKTRILSIKGDQLSAESGSFPTSSLISCSFDAFPVAAKESGIVLADGTRLSGIIRERKDGSISFRSTTFGILEMKEEEISIEYRAWKEAGYPADTAPCAIDVSGKVHKGRILWSDEKSTGVMTPEGIRKIPAPEIAAVVRRKNAAASRIVLRNGDVVNWKPDFAGSTLKFLFNGRKLETPLSSASSIKFK